MPKERKYRELRELKGKLRAEGKSYKDVAEEVGMEVATLSNKINGHAEFKLNEIEKLVAILNIKQENIAKYFFPDMLRKAN